MTSPIDCSVSTRGFTTSFSSSSSSSVYSTGFTGNVVGSVIRLIHRSVPTRMKNVFFDTFLCPHNRVHRERCWFKGGVFSSRVVTVFGSGCSVKNCKDYFISMTFQELYTTLCAAAETALERWRVSWFLGFQRPVNHVSGVSPGRG